MKNHFGFFGIKVDLARINCSFLHNTTQHNSSELSKTSISYSHLNKMKILLLSSLLILLCQASLAMQAPRRGLDYLNSFSSDPSIHHGSHSVTSEESSSEDFMEVRPASTSSFKKKSTNTTASSGNASYKDYLESLLEKTPRGGGGGGSVEHGAKPVANMEDDSFSIEDLFQQHAPHLQISDNPQQLKVLQHHYWNEFGRHVSLHEVMRDYSDTAVLHTVLDGVPTSYTRDQIPQAFRALYRLLPHDETHLEFEHIAVNHDHAQVVWKARLANGDRMRGTDSFAFSRHDGSNQIEHQTTVALTWNEE